MALSSDGSVGLAASCIIGGSQTILLLKLDGEGSTEWSNSYYFNGINPSSVSVAALQDGGFVIGGKGTTASSKQIKTFVFKVDSSGTFTWGMRSQDAGVSLTNGRVLVTESDDVILGGYMENSFYYNNFLLKLSSDGTVQWMKSYEVQLGEFTCKIHTMGSDSIYFASQYYQDLENLQLLIGKTNLDGELQTSVKYELYGNQVVRDMAVDGDGNLVILSFSQIFPDLQGSISLNKFSPSLQLIAKKAYDHAGDKLSPIKLTALSDGRYLVSSEITQTLDESKDGLLVKFESDFSVCGNLTPLDETVILQAGGQFESTQAAAFSFAPFTLSTDPLSLSVQTFDLNTLRHNSGVCDVYDASYSPLLLPTTPTNTCGCSENGSCQSGSCTCSSGYTGSLCQFLSSEFQGLVISATAQVLILYQSYNALSPFIALTEAKYLSSTPDIVTLLSAERLCKVVVDLLTTQGEEPHSNELIQLAIQVLSNLSLIILRNDQEYLYLTKLITYATSQVIEVNLSQISSIDTKHIDIIVTNLESTQTTSLSHSSELAVQIPQMEKQCDGLVELVTVSFESLHYAALTPSYLIQQAPLFAVDLYCNGLLLQLSRLQNPVKLTFGVRSTEGSELLSQIYNGTLSAEKALVDELFQCHFYDDASNSLSREGCSVVCFTDSSFECECSHLTNFASFFSQGAEVLTQSNYDVWLALPHITVSSLRSNIGFYISVNYWLLFCVIGICALKADHKHLKGKWVPLLFQLTHKNEPQKPKQESSEDKSSYPVVSFDGRSSFSQKKRSLKIKAEKLGFYS